MIPQNLSFVDVETTGVNPTKDRIIEIGIVRIEEGKVKDTYQSLIDPQVYLPPEITTITGITFDQLEGAPTFRNEKDRIDEILDGSIMVAHNAQFDSTFIKAEYSRLGQRFKLKAFCTARLSRLLFPQYKRHSLDSLIERFGLKCDLRHRAYPDAYVLWDFYQIVLREFGEEKVGKVIKNFLKKPSVPKGLNHRIVDSLPKDTGVYIFYGDNDTPLYVGKSVNIYNRVQSHFNSQHKSSKEFHIAQQTKFIEAKVTSGELAALLTEKKLIRDLKPLYNRKLRDTRSLLVAMAKKSSGGYESLKLTESSQVSNEDITNILAVFKSRGHAKRTLTALAKDYFLCKKLLGLEKGKGACFGCQIEDCFGACTEKESSLKYNMRFSEAFANTKVREWPFSGPIVIPEKETGHLIYRWCYLGSGDEEDIVEIAKNPEISQFDYDTYKILSSYLLNPKNSIHVKVLNNKRFLKN